MEQVNLDTLLAKADIITLHTPGGKDTKNLICKATLDKCKTGVFLVNAGRGGVLNEADLLAALESGKVSHPLFFLGAVAAVAVVACLLLLLLSLLLLLLLLLLLRLLLLLLLQQLLLLQLLLMLLQLLLLLLQLLLQLLLLLLMLLQLLLQLLLVVATDVASCLLPWLLLRWLTTDCRWFTVHSRWRVLPSTCSRASPRPPRSR